MSEPALAVEHLVKRYGTTTALEGVSVAIAPGEIFALLGPNGAGKTTLIGAVCGLVRKTSGTIRVFGVDLDQDPLGPRYQIGLVPQEVNFDPFFTAREALRIQLGYYGRRRDEDRISEVLQALSLTTKADVETRALSGGMKRRLLIAKALVHRPKLLFLDEPTAGVDVELRRDLWAYVRRLRAEGTTIVLTTHYIDEAEELADRVGVISEGRLLVLEEKRELMRKGERRLLVRFREAVSPARLPEVTRGRATLSEDGQALSYVQRDGAPGATELLGALYAAGLAIADVELRQPRLEDVMLSLLHSERP